jgi:hypothetical protein
MLSGFGPQKKHAENASFIQRLVVASICSGVPKAEQK